MQLLCVALAGFLATPPAPIQVDPELARQYFAEAAVLCEREGGGLWGRSLEGPMVFADPATRTIACNQPEPAAPRPAALGFANAAMDWGGTRWSTYVWQMLPREDARARGRMLMHELYHRIQPDLGLLVGEGSYVHLDTVEGRTWLQLEWRALAQALGRTGAERLAAVGDALAFRAARRARFPEAAAGEQRLEMNEGMAQYTGTVTSFEPAAAAAADAIQQLADAAREETFVRTFAYPSGAAYGILLDEYAPGWTRQLGSGDDLAALLATAADPQPSADVAAAEARHGGPALREAEEQLDVQRKAKLAELRRRFVEGPRLVFPNGRNAVFLTRGMTPLPGEGTVVPSLRVTAEWGSLDAASVLLSDDRRTLALPVPFTSEGPVLRGDGWTITLADGWVAHAGGRPGDFELAEER